ncbi:MAG: prepilin-type N-terminal cleavage/methylation domain-containing protein [Syntrophomonadaceae bacterium]|jgi:prepilin-type N-terminal cleavage/methylation domain-containing protein
MIKKRVGLALIYPQLRDCAGVTLLEVLVALILLGILSGSLLQLTNASGLWLEDAARQGQASDLAFGILEYYRADPGRLNNGPLSGDDAWGLLLPDYGGESTYRWEVVYQAGDAQPGLLHVSVKVSWDVKAAEKEVQMCTLLYRQP